jgi:phospholipase/carboxylesterase
MKRYSRREFLGVAAAGTGAFAAACNLDTAAPQGFSHADALIKARPGTPTLTPTIGYSALGITLPRDGLLYVPTTYRSDTPAPLVVLLHGNASSAQFWEDMGIGSLVDDLGIVVVAPDSRYASWDFLVSGVRGYGPDPAFINIALAYTFLRCNINPARIAIAGFSDGGAEALGLGVANGDLFTHVMGYSPSVLFAPFTQGKPKVFLSHGTVDSVIPFENTKVQIVPKMVAAGYDVTFVEFAGNHAIPGAVARQSFGWLLA